MDKNFTNRISHFVSQKGKMLPVVIFGIITLLIFNNVGVFKHISDKPNSYHTWAQTDRASVAASYYNESMNFFKPRVYNRGDGTNSGISGMEFPVINYLAAICYKLFGFHEFYYRLINFILLFVGILFAFLLAELFLADIFYSAICVWSFMLSPVLMFYSANFLPDTGSLGLVLMSWYFFFRISISSHHRRNLIIFIALITMACLIKLTSMVSLVTMIILMTMSHMRLLKSEIIPQLNLRMIVGLAVCFICVLSWYRYATWLNDTYQNYFFILKGNAVKNMLELKQVLSHVYVKPFKDYYPLLMRWVIAILFFYFISTVYFQNRLLVVTFFILFIGFSAFAWTMLRQFQDHDYYIISLLFLVFFLLLTSLDMLQRKLKKKIRILYIISIAGFILLINMSMVVCKKNYQTERYGKGYSLISYADYDRFWKVSSYLDSLRIGKSDLVISYYDPTPNTSLYLMDRKGATVRCGDMWKVKSLISSNNFKYLILKDTDSFSSELYTSLLDKKIGEKYNLQIFQLKK